MQPRRDGRGGSAATISFASQNLVVVSRSRKCETRSRKGRRVSDGTWAGCRQLGVRVAAPAAMLHRTNMVSRSKLTRGVTSRAQCQR